MAQMTTFTTKREISVVRVSLTELGRDRLEALSALHLEELKRPSPRLRGLSRGLEGYGRSARSTR